MVGPNTTYNAYAEVTEMFIHDGSQTEPVPVEIRANTTLDYVVGLISEAMNSHSSSITRSIIPLTGIVASSTTESLTLQSHSPSAAAHSATEPIRPISTATATATAQIQAVGSR
jgi:hypothetical protein